MTQPPEKHTPGRDRAWPGDAEIKRPVRRARRPVPLDLTPDVAPSERSESAGPASPPGPSAPFPDPHADPVLASPAGSPGGLTARTMALAGSTFIVLLSLVLMLGGLSLGGGSDSALHGANGSPGDPSNPGAGGGSACVAATRDLLCQAKAQANSTTVTGTDVQIRTSGPGGTTLGDPRKMIDGREDTTWTSGGESTGLKITLQFKFPVSVGLVGLTTATGGEPSGSRVRSATWSFAGAQTGSGGFCPVIPAAFGFPVRQDFSAAGGTLRMVPPVPACAVQVTIDELSRGTGAGGGDVAISELTLLAP